MPDNYPFKSGYNGKFYLIYVFTKEREKEQNRTHTGFKVILFQVINYMILSKSCNLSKPVSTSVKQG